MAILGSDRQQLGYKKEEGTINLRSFVESTIISESPDIDRITRYTLYWHFYNGKHWRQYNETFLSFNYVRAFIDKVINFLLGRNGFSFKISSYDNRDISEDVERQIEGFYEYHWRMNRKLTVIHDILQMGSITGDVWVHLGWDTKMEYVTLGTLDSRHCFPDFVNGDISRMDKFTLRQPLIKNKDDYKVLCIEYTTDTITQWYQKDTAQEGKRYLEKEAKNHYGFIPIVHIKNKPSSDGYYSKSDCADILKINKVYNEMTQQLKSIIDYYGTPTTVITGGTVKTLRKGLGNIWSGLPPEANVFNLGLGEDLNSSIQFVKEILKTGMHELADVPENTLGKLQAISNTSAAALQITYQPLIQQADLKWLTYGDGIMDINLMMVQITRIMAPKHKSLEGLPDKFETDYLAESVFTYGLPQDRSVELNQANIELSAHIASRREIMNRLGKKNVPNLLSEINEDWMRQQIIQTSMAGGDGAPDLGAGNDGEDKGGFNTKGTPPNPNKAAKKIDNSSPTVPKTP